MNLLKRSFTHQLESRKKIPTNIPNFEMDYNCSEVSKSVWSRQTYSSILKPPSQYVLHTYSFVCALNIFR